MKKRGEEVWIGVDFDGTLSLHEPGASLSIVGPPILPMLALVQKWLSDGWRVKIFTARVGTKEVDRETQITLIQTWCEMYLGRILEVTCEKDGAMIAVFDDRAIAVERNTGNIRGFESFGLLNHR